jgi:hypothetical protein
VSDAAELSILEARPRPVGRPPRDGEPEPAEDGAHAKPKVTLHAAIESISHAQRAMVAFDEATQEMQRKHDLARTMIVEICRALQGHAMPVDRDLLGRSAIAQISIRR